jgi:hypothetical protein
MMRARLTAAIAASLLVTSGVVRAQYYQTGFPAEEFRIRATPKVLDAIEFDDMEKMVREQGIVQKAPPPSGVGDDPLVLRRPIALLQPVPRLLDVAVEHEQVVGVSGSVKS